MSKKGLYNKYHIIRNDGKEIPEDALYFVLRYDEDTKDGRSATEALKLFSENCENRGLGKELYNRLVGIENEHLAEFKRKCP